VSVANNGIVLRCDFGGCSSKIDTGQQTEEAAREWTLEYSAWWQLLDRTLDGKGHITFDYCGEHPVL
jgi:hypothetical protein